MPELWGQLLPVALLGLLAPVPIAIVVTLLMTRDGGLAKAVGFVVAATVVYAAVGALVLTLPLDSLGPAASVVGGVLLIAIGLALWWLAVVQLRRGRRGAGPPPSYLDRIGALSPRTVWSGAALLTLVNVKQLGLYLIGVTTIVRSDASTGQGWAALACFLLVFQVGQLLVLGVYAAAQDRAAALLHRFHDWLLPRMRLASIVLGGVVGAFFLALGAGLLAP